MDKRIRRIEPNEHVSFFKKLEEEGKEYVLIYRDENTEKLCVLYQGNITRNEILVDLLKPQASELSPNAEKLKCYASGCNRKRKSDSCYCKEHKKFFTSDYTHWIYRHETRLKL